jgi:chaperonin cofactor prefoldin
LSNDINGRVDTLENQVEVIADKVDRIDENVAHLSNGGLKDKLQDQNEYLTE